MFESDQYKGRKKMAGERVLVIDDETDISKLIDLYLTKNSFQVTRAKSGAEALELVNTQNPDLIILDILLPDTDGIALCQELRKITESPILFLSCKNDDMDKILGLTVGGDDYITKPFSPGELVARVKAHLRRYRIVSTKMESKDSVLQYKGLSIDLLGHTVNIFDRPVDLTLKEFQVLALLVQNPNSVLSMGQIYDSVWGVDNMGDTRTVMVHISSIRKKIEKNPADPRIIITVKGVGYRFDPNALEDADEYPGKSDLPYKSDREL